MKKTVHAMLVALVVLATFNANAQAVRYLDEVFTTVKVDTNVVYGQNKGFLTGFSVLEDLKMDVYQADGDTATNRPLIILMHAGSYLPGSLTGFTFADKNENCIVELCNRYAKRGWVAVSMTYRLGWNPQGANQEDRSRTIIQAVYRSAQDVRNCVRYFKHEFANGNQWGVDTGKIVLGGSNSGAYTALAAMTLNDTNELSNPATKFVGTNGPFINQSIMGDFDGFGGTQNSDNYPGISSRFQAVLPLGGAVGDTSWIQPGETPAIAFHGVDEFLTPYNTATVITSTLQPVVEVSGAGDYMQVVDQLNLNAGFKPNNFKPGPPNRTGGGVVTTSIDGLYPFYGQGFEPWNWYQPTNPSINPTASQAKALAYIDTIVGYATPRLYKLLIDPTYDLPSSIREVVSDIEMTTFPNPAVSSINVIINTLQSPMAEIRLHDVAGRLVKNETGINAYNYSVNVRDLNSGVYVMTVRLNDGSIAARRVVVEK